MNDYAILNNMPYQDLIQFWEKDRNNLKDLNLFLWYDELNERPWKSLNIKESHPIHDIIQRLFLDIGVTTTFIQYMITVANHGMEEKLHIDMPLRKTAINIPIQIQERSQFFLMGNSKDLVPYNNTQGTPKFYYQPEKCSFYNSRKPWVFNTQEPHSFANYAPEDRVLLSISIEEDYDTVLKALPKEWF